MEGGSMRKRRAGRGTGGRSRGRDVGARDGGGRDKGGSDGRFFTLFKIAVCLLLSPILFLVAVDLTVSSPIDPESFTLPPPPKFEGPLAPNDLLSKAERLHEGELRGPESIIVQHGHLYTGTADGEILHIENGIIRTVARLGRPPCGKYEDEPHCGRPLGMRFDKDGFLVVVDAYLGLFRVNVTSGEVKTLYRSTKEIDGKVPMFLNDLDIASDGTIYLTDSSSNWGRRNNRLLITENPGDGRLIKYDPVTKSMSVLADGLYFPNGVQLSHQEDYLLVVSTTRCLIYRYYLEGEKAETIDIFAENLPGLPDNIRRSSSGGFWVGMAIIRREDRFSLFDFTASRPWIRRLSVKVLSEQMRDRTMASPYGLIVEFDTKGNIVRSLHDPTGKTIPSVSEIEDNVSELYLGSYHSSFIGRLKIHSTSKR